MIDKSRPIVLTGGAGFIGQHLARELGARGYTSIHIVDNFYTSSPEQFASVFSNLHASFCRMDVRDKDVSFSIPDRATAIINLASPASPKHYQKDPDYTFSTNVDGTRNLVKRANEIGARFVQCSTSEIYGCITEGVMGEFYTQGYVNTVGPRSCYDEGKRAAETACYLEKLKGLDVRIVRIFNTFGPGMDINDGRIIPEFTKNFVLGEIPQVYDGERFRCYSPVSFTVDGIIRVLEVEKPEEWVYNIGSVRAFKNREVLDKIAHLLGKEGYVWNNLPPRADDTYWRMPSLYNILELGWEAPTEKDFDKCLKETVEDIRERIKILKHGKE